jgi:hypothetical protein
MYACLFGNWRSSFMTLISAKISTKKVCVSEGVCDWTELDIQQLRITEDSGDIELGPPCPMRETG